MKRIIQWLKPSLEGDDNKSSYRRLSALVILMLMTYVTAAGKITTMIGLYVLMTHAVVFLLLVGIITADNIITLVNKYKNDK